MTGSSAGRSVPFGAFKGRKPRSRLVSAQSVTARIMATPRWYSLLSLASLVFRQHDQVVAEHAQPDIPGETLKPTKETAKESETRVSSRK